VSRLAIVLLDGVRGDAGIVARGEQGQRAPAFLLAFLDVSAAALDDDFVEQGVALQHVLSLSQICFACPVALTRLRHFGLELLFHRAEMAGERMNADVLEVVGPLP
jgi:hypothetical protein